MSMHVTEVRCPRCKGEGRVLKLSGTGRAQVREQVTCTLCLGEGVVLVEPMPGSQLPEGLVPIGRSRSPLMAELEPVGA